MARTTITLVTLILGASAVSMATLAQDRSTMHKMPTSMEMPPKIESSVGELSSLTRATAWLNTQPLNAASLRGKVVLIDVWTLTCINWLRTAAYIRAWSRKYRDHGLVVIGVHAPEFPFERDIDNVRRAVERLGLNYAIAADNDFAIWRAFDNAAWPALFFVDAQGRLRHHHFGEGAYEESERLIQKLLADAGATGIPQELVSVDSSGVEAAADWANLRSPENYLGYDRTERFASQGGAVLGRSRAYVAPTRLKLNHWALSGDWTMQKGASVLNTVGGRILYQFHARDLHLVMGPGTPGKSVRFRVRIDGQPPQTGHGADVDDQGNGIVTDRRLNQLIRQPKPVTDRIFEIEFMDPGVEVFAFTFG
jgi:thiol-disulfide isomerase/thioredoxin